MDDLIILVDEADNPVGFEEKLKAHQEGKLHRAFSIFIFNEDGELLLQKRAHGKYHSAGLWTNTCCSHPRPNEDTLKAARRRLEEEMGFDCGLKEIFKFNYKAKLDGGIIENELDHVFVGQYGTDPIINKTEVEDFKWVNIEWLETDMSEHPEQYTIWFKICFKEVLTLKHGASGKV